MLKKLLKIQINIFKSIRKENKARPKPVKAALTTQIKNGFQSLSIKHLLRITFLAPSIGIGLALLCYNIKNYSAMCVILIAFTAPQVAGASVALLIILIAPIFFLNKKLSVFGDGVCYRIETISEKINVNSLVYISWFAWLLFDSYMVAIFLLEPVKSYTMLYIMIAQFNFIQPFWTLLLDVYSKMLMEFIQVVKHKLDTKCHDDNYTDPSCTA